MTREEWDSRHQPMFRDGSRIVLCGEPVLPLKAQTFVTEQGHGVGLHCIHCGHRPAPAMTREEWDKGHNVWGTSDCGCSVDLEPGKIPSCPSCGPRPPAAAEVGAMEWRPLTDTAQSTGFLSCHRVRCSECPRNSEPGYYCSIQNGYEHRWPSGEPGVGKPEFRRVGQEHSKAVVPRYTASVQTDKPDPAKHVHLRELAKEGHDIGETDASECPMCDAVLPADLCELIRSGSHDCPSCGWHSGRCDHCHTLLVPTYKPGVRDGSRHCPNCDGVDE